MGAGGRSHDHHIPRLVNEYFRQLNYVTLEEAQCAAYLHDAAFDIVDSFSSVISIVKIPVTRNSNDLEEGELIHADYPQAADLEGTFMYSGDSGVTWNGDFRNCQDLICAFLYSMQAGNEVFIKMKCDVFFTE